jgi:UDP-N-acetylmuramoylalanine--D-glutamate ligase
MDLAGKNIVIVGLARSGAAAARLAASRGARVTVNDAKPIERLGDEARALEAEGVRVVAGAHPDALFEAADLIVVSPGVPADLPILADARARGLPVVGEVELASWSLRGRVVGVTGTNGKTTTTTLLAEILRDGGLPTEVGGNIGTPLTSLVERSTDETWTVAELSSFQLELVDRFRVHRAILLNLTPDHLDRHRTMEAYAAAKGRIFANQHADDLAVLNADDPLVVEFADRTRARVCFFSSAGELGAGVCRVDDRIVWREAGGVVEELMPIDEVPLFGEHNLENVCAALAVGRDLGVPAERMRATVRAFRGVEHRLERVADVDGVLFFNDSKATNTDAAIKAIVAFDGRPGKSVVIMGGRGKGQDFSSLAAPSRGRVRHAVLIGEASGAIETALAGICPSSRARSMREAVRAALEAAEPGDRVLLAPACASFDLFDDYEHRGRIFKQEVDALAPRVYEDQGPEARGRSN